MRCLLVCASRWIGSVVRLGSGAGIMNYYESGGVKPYPQHLHDQQNKCGECGKVWVGVNRFLCSDCYQFAKFIEEKEDGK